MINKYVELIGACSGQFSQDRQKQQNPNMNIRYTSDPGPVTSTGTSITISFHANRIFTASGFLAVVCCSGSASIFQLSLNVLKDFPEHYICTEVRSTKTHLLYIVVCEADLYILMLYVSALCCKALKLKQKHLELKF